MTGYVVTLRNGGGHLRRTPYDGSYRFLAASMEHATVFSESVAVQIAARETANGRPCDAWPDHYWKREPEITELPAQYRRAA